MALEFLSRLQSALLSTGYDSIILKSTQPTTTGISVIGRLINFFRRLHCIALRHDRNATYRSNVKKVFILVATLYALL